MKIVLALIATLAFSNAFAAVQCRTGDKDLLNWAIKMQTIAQNRFTDGLASNEDLIVANAFVVEVKYCSGVIDKATYCTLAQKAQADRVAAETAGYKAGTRTIDDVLNARVDLAEVQKDCS